MPSTVDAHSELYLTPICHLPGRECVWFQADFVRITSVHVFEYSSNRADSDCAAVMGDVRSALWNLARNKSHQLVLSGSYVSPASCCDGIEGRPPQCNPGPVTDSRLSIGRPRTRVCACRARILSLLASSERRRAGGEGRTRDTS